MTIEPNSVLRLRHTGRLIRVEKISRTGRCTAHYVLADGSKAKPEFKNVATFSLDFLEVHSVPAANEGLTSSLDPLHHWITADDAAA